ncbi:helix-turn-helix domain-containing protein [Halostella litorea]|uniref:helix-turn-helix domain-containing protein n=1 Tax=Halostella litorea TaxID=2528831 RepID=UPI001092B868|nr:helix-turn-helix domain-containing protein [Halostella litorea]
MKHVRLTLDADGREAAVHPMYDVLANAPFVERATAIHWNFAGDELGILHRVEGDADAFAEAAESVPEVIDHEVEPAGPGVFHAYVRDATNEPLRRLLSTVAGRSVVVVPPVEYGPDGAVSFAAVGPAAEIRAAVDELPEPVGVEVDAVRGLSALDPTAALSERQREALEAALALGYYDVPRRATQADVAEAMGCAPSTAAEHIRKGEAAALRSLLGG